jgi:hypothetical protein
MRYVETALLRPARCGKEGCLLLAAELIAASVRVACALLAPSDTERRA